MIRFIFRKYRTARYALNGTAAALTALATLYLSTGTSLLNGWDDLRWSLFSKPQQSQVYFIDIDESSLTTYGRWPWPRERIARLLDNLLTKHKAAVIGVDILFSESDGNAATSPLAGLDQDRLVWAHAASLGDEPSVGKGIITAAPLCPTPNPWNPKVNGWLGLSDTIGGTSFRGGHIRPWPDRDQIVRMYMPFLPNGSQCVPALGLAIYGALLGIPADAPLTHNGDGWRWGGVPLGLDENGLLRLVWHTASIKAVPAHKILEGTIELPANAVMVLGSTAVGMGDFVRIPNRERFTGAGVHGLAFLQWLDRDFINTLPYQHTVTWALLCAIFLVFWYTSSSNALKPWGIAVAIVLAWNLAAYYLWTRGIYFSAEPVLWALVWLPAIQGLRLWQEKKTSKLIYDQFHAYLPEKVLQKLISAHVDPRELDAQSKEVSILFADLRGFTSLSENQAPENVVSLLNEVMEYLSQCIARHDGTLDKFIGDSVMAFWGAPVDMTDHADKAVACALDMLDHLHDLNDHLARKGFPSVDLSIGVNSGIVAVGNMGSVSRKNYTVVGDNVNTAARLQQFTKTLQCRLLIGASTAAMCRKYDLVQLREIELRGKKKQVMAYTAQTYAPTRTADQD
jgi:adenylate cyclase